VRIAGKSVLAWVCMAGAALAGCPQGATTVLGCTLGGGAKTLSLCIDGDTVRYDFGKTGQPPELSLSEPVATVAHQPWPGVGRAIWEATTLTNAGYAYEVWMSVDRLSENALPEGGVNVMQGEKTVAELRCDPGTASVSLWAVDDAKQALGICWNFETFSWGGCSG